MEKAQYDWRRGISYAAEFGGNAIPHRIVESIHRLRTLLRDASSKFYSDEVLGIALTVRVDGELKQYPFEGVDRIRRNRRGKYVTADIGIPAAQWKRLTPQEFDDYLFASTQAALLACADRVQRDGVAFDKIRMERDLAKIRARFSTYRTMTGNGIQ